MGTKNKPGAFDCYANAEPDEPMFVLLGRDVVAGTVVRYWRALREAMSASGAVKNELTMLDEASACAAAMDAWAKSKGKDPSAVGNAMLERLKRIDYLEAGLRNLIAHHTKQAEVELEDAKDDPRPQSPQRDRLKGKAQVRQPPEAVDDFFGGSEPDEAGVEVDLDDAKAVSEWSDKDSRDGYEVDLEKLRKSHPQITRLRFYNSW